VSVNIKRAGAILLGIILSLPASGATFNIFGPVTGILKGSATSPITTAATWSDVSVLLSGTCNSSVFVRGDGTCVAVSLTSGVSGTLPVANGGTNLTAASDDNVMVGNGTTWQSKALTDCDGASSAVTYDVTTNAWGCNTISTISGAALTKTNDTNVTLTLGGSPTTALVNAASITAGWTGQLAASRGGTGVSSLGDLTKADDTNVTLTLGGTPTGALITSASITAGWTGTLAASRGGLGMSTVTDDTVAVANGTTWQSKAVPTCTDTSGNHLNYDTSTNAFSCGTSSSASTVSGANPTAAVGLSAVNGVATTYLRSDGSPALSQSIVPTWTGRHVFSAVASSGLDYPVEIASTVPGLMINDTNAGTNAGRSAFLNNGSQFTLLNYDDAGTTGREILKASRTGVAVTSLVFGNATDNNTFGFLGTGAVAFGGAISSTNTGGALSWFGPDNTATGANVSIGTNVASPQANASRGTLFVNGVNDSLISLGHNEGQDGFIYASSSELRVQAAAGIPLTFHSNAVIRSTIASNGGLFMDGATGGSQGAGTINATGLFVNGVTVDAGHETIGTFTGTLTGVTSGTCSMKYRKVGNFVTLYIASGGCSGTSNAATLTMTGLPAAIQTSLGAAVLGMCLDNGTGLLTSCAAIFTASSGTMVMGIAKTNLTTGITTYDSSGWTAANAKGLSTNFVIQYQTGT
jgi:hypothetical protein